MKSCIKQRLCSINSTSIKNNILRSKICIKILSTNDVDTCKILILAVIILNLSRIVGIN